MKLKLILLMMAMSLIWTGCASQKKLDSGDEFSVDDTPASSGAPSDDLSLDGAAPANSGGGSDELSLDEPAANPTAAKSDASDMDAALENELNSLDNGAAPQPVEQAAANELSLDEPSAPIAQNTPPVTPEVVPPEVAPPAEVAVAPEVVAPVPEQSLVEPAPVASGAPVTINNVQYMGNNNGGAVTIAADQPLQFTTRFNSITNQFIVEVQNSTIPKKLTRTLNTKDMASSIGSVDIYQKSGSNVSRFVVQLRPGSSEPIVQPEGNALLIIGASISGGSNEPSASVADSGLSSTETAPAPENSSNDSFGMASNSLEESTRRTKGGVLDYQNLEEFLMGEQQFTGKKINIEASNIKVADAISFLSDESGTNIVMDDAVATAGVINNIRLRQVPWDQALVMILKSKKLVYRRQGNVLFITSLDTLKREEEEAITLRESRKLQEPLVVRRFLIAYANLSDLRAQVEEYMKSLPATKPPVGVTATINKVIVDTRNNALIVTETDTNLKNIEQIIKAIDTQPKQVLIESKIVVADETFTRSLGIKWGATGRTETPNAVIAIDPGNVSQGVLRTDISWGQIDFLGSLTSTLNFGEQQRQLKVLASPSITVLSNVEALITKTTDVVQLTSTTTTNPTTGAPNAPTQTQTLIPVGMTLAVTPTVTNENTISLKLNLTRSTKAASDAGKTASNAKTEMIVKSGLTAVVGGIYESSQDDTATGVPGLRQIPVLGKLFEASDKITNKNELMMFITPTILRPL
jgi:type IV pilus assembly protein PilQ